MMSNLIYGFWLGTALLVNYFLILTIAFNRFHLVWSHTDTFALFVLHLLLSLLFAYLFSLIKSEKARTITPFLFFLAYLVFAVQLNFYIYLLIAIAFYMAFDKEFMKPIMKFRSPCYSAIMVLAIMFCAYAYGVLILSPQYNKTPGYSNVHEANALVNQKLPKNVIYLLFDRLSYQELYLTSDAKKSGVNPKYSNFKAFADDAWNFHGVFSPYRHTRQSIPIMTGLNEKQNIFDYIKSKGYKTNVLGLYMNYCDFVKGADYCKSYSWQRLEHEYGSFWASFVRHLFYFPTARNDNADSILIKNRDTYVARRAYELQKDTEKELFEILKPGLEGAFVYAHIMVPHSPSVFNKDGVIKEILSVFEDHPKRTEREEYDDNLGYANVLVGQILKHLKSNALYEDSLIIFSSDHSCQDDTVFHDLAQDKLAADFYAYHQETKQKHIDDNEDFERLLLDTHVPLIVKMPGQSSSKHHGAFLSNAKLFKASNEGLFDDADFKLSKSRIKKLKDQLILSPQRNTQFELEDFSSTGTEWLKEVF